jgi:hypothetical protein
MDPILIQSNPDHTFTIHFHNTYSLTLTASKYPCLRFKHMCFKWSLPWRSYRNCTLISCFHHVRNGSFCYLQPWRSVVAYQFCDYQASMSPEGNMAWADSVQQLPVLSTGISSGSPSVRQQGGYAHRSPEGQDTETPRQACNLKVVTTSM